MHPAFNSKLVQSHIDDLHRSAAADAHRAEARRVKASQRSARQPQLVTFSRPSVMRRLAARLAH
jgi:hypothetical protein